MTKSECRYCGCNAYADGKCYADRCRTGRPVEDYIECDWARKKQQLNKRQKQ